MLIGELKREMGEKAEPNKNHKLNTRFNHVKIGPIGLID